MEVWDGAEVLNNARIHESVLCLAPHELTRQELRLVAGDAQFIKSIDEAPAVAEASYAAVVVFAAGLELARELLQLNALDGTCRIHWQLGLDLMEVLETGTAATAVWCAGGKRQPLRGGNSCHHRADHRRDAGHRQLPPRGAGRKCAPARASGSGASGNGAGDCTGHGKAVAGKAAAHTANY